MGKFDQPNEGMKGTGGRFISLKDSEFVTGVIRGDVRTYRAKWDGGKYVECGPEEGGFRFKANIVINESGTLVAKIFENGWKLYKAFKALEDAGYDLDATTVRISRKGGQMNDTVYSITPVPNGGLAGNSLLMVESVMLQSLKGDNNAT